MRLPYHWLGREAEQDASILESYELARVEREAIESILPDFTDIQHDE